MNNTVTVKVHIENAEEALEKLRADNNATVKIVIPVDSLDKGGFTIHIPKRQHTFLTKRSNGKCTFNATIDTFGGDISNITNFFEISDYDPNLPSNLDTTTSDQIDDMLEDYDGFFGVYANNKFPVDYIPTYFRTTKNRPCSIVVNYDNDDEPGTHWCGIFISATRDSVEYFDPFGLPPKKRILSALKKLKLPIVMINSQIQHIDSHACGYYVVEYIKMRYDGVPIYDIVFDVFDKSPAQNEKTLQALVNE